MPSSLRSSLGSEVDDSSDTTVLDRSEVVNDCHDGDADSDDGCRSRSPRRLRVSVAPSAPLGGDSMEGYMTVQRKKPKKQRFQLPKSARFVVANAVKHTLEVYNNETRSEVVYLLSLADAVLGFEADTAAIVMEKCFCVEVKTWKKKSTVHFQPQSFLFFVEDQARMLLWVKCIHQAIKRATTLDSDLFSSSAYSRSGSGASGDSSPRRFSDSVVASEAKPEVRRSVSGGGSPAVVSVPSPTSPSASVSAFSVAREKLKQRLSLDTTTRSFTSGRGFLSPRRASSDDRPLTPLNRLSAMFSGDKYYQLRSPRTSEASESVLSPSRVGTATPKRSTSGQRFGKTAHMGPADVAVAQILDAPANLRSRPSSVGPAVRSNRGNNQHCSDSKAVGETLEFTDDSTTPRRSGTVAGVCSDPNCRANRSNAPSLRLELRDEHEPRAAFQTLVVLLVVAAVSGVLSASVFLPVASAGVVLHLHSQHEQFVAWAIASVVVHVSSSCHVMFGVTVASIVLYAWGYADFRIQRRRHARQTALLDPQQVHERAELPLNIDLPNWVRHPDVDSVEWLNKVFVTGWPYIKIAIRNSVLGSVNPLLDAQRPAFMSALSLVRIELGNKTPHISGVKFVSANALTDEVTLDVEVRVVTDKSFVAELKMASHLGAAACVALRDLFLVGTLRITLNPLVTDWPCFSALSLSFTTRPVFDFSLTAAKINIANVPFASEWLRTFLHDLLLDYFVWPKVVQIPLWDEQGCCADQAVEAVQAIAAAAAATVRG